MRHRPQDLVGLRSHGEGHVGEQRVVVIVRQLFVAQIGVLAVAPCGTQGALLLLQGNAHIPGAPIEVLGIEIPATHDVVQRRLDLLRLALATRQRAFHQHAAMAILEDLERGVLVGVVDVGAQLRVQGNDVIGLVEVVLNHLPVAVHFTGEVHHSHHLVHLVGFELVGHHAQRVTQGGCLRIHVEPHQATEGFAAQLLEMQLADRIALREILGILGNQQAAVQAVAPAVVVADQALHLGLLALDHAIAAVLTNVVEGADVTVVVAQDEDRLATDLNGDHAARLRQLGHSASDMPDAGPHVIPLLLHELAGVVAIASDRVAAQEVFIHESFLGAFD
ncbi:hypothetical protein D3C81_1284510 [compost metagenome]